VASFDAGDVELTTSVNLEGLNEGIDKAEKTTEKGFGKIGDIIKGALGVGIAAGAGAIAAGLAGIASGIGDAREAAQIMAQTEAVIKSTGGAAGFTAQQIGDMAGALSAAEGMSLFGDSDIQQGQNLLLTFTNIKETLPDATKVMVDMAQAMGTDVKGGAIQLGKALNDPIAGISALSRVGVTFTEEQKEQIRVMQEAGNVAGAQRLILAELNKEFGGSAAAAAAADGGWARVNDRIGEMWEAVGVKLLPVINKFADYLNDNVLPTLEANLEPALETLVKWLENDLPPAVEAASNWFSTVLMPALRDTWTFLNTYIIPVLQEVWTWLLQNLPPAIKQAAQWFDTVLRPALNDLWAFIQANVIPVLQKVGSWLMNDLPPAIKEAQRWIDEELRPALAETARVFDEVFGKAIRAAIVSFENVMAPLTGTIQLFKDLAAVITGLPNVPGYLAAGARLPGFASGTDWYPGGASIVGERGPELFVGPRGGQILSARQTSRVMSGGGGGTVNVVVSIRDGGQGWLEKLITVKAEQTQTAAATRGQARARMGG
jgi:hypothetical protein